MRASKPEPVCLALARDPALAAEIARRILNAHFPESIRQDVADSVGLSLDAENAASPEQAQRWPDSGPRQGIPAASGVSGVAQGGSVQGAGAGVAGRIGANTGLVSEIG
jgi:hypothetical protein